MSETSASVSVSASVSTVLVVPCFNEAKRFHSEAFSEALAAHPDLGLLFVNDGSQDQTQSVLQAFIARHPRQSSLLNLPVNGGKAEAVRSGMLRTFQKDALEPWSANALEHVGYWDADLATPFSEYRRFLEVFREKPEIWLVMGARVNLLGRSIKRHSHRHYLGRVFATAASYILKLPVYDTQCGAKMFRFRPEVKSLFQSPFISGWIFDVELLARLGSSLQTRQEKPQDLIYELPLLHWQDVEGSKIKPKDFLKASFSLFRLAKLYPRFDHSMKKAESRV